MHEISGKLLIHRIGGATERGIKFDSIGYFASGPELFPSGGPQFLSWFLYNARRESWTDSQTDVFYG